MSGQYAWATTRRGDSQGREPGDTAADRAVAASHWRERPLDEAKQDAMVAAFLRHMAFELEGRASGPSKLGYYSACFSGCSWGSF
jgi:hypothetical protein